MAGYCVTRVEQSHSNAFAPFIDARARSFYAVITQRLIYRRESGAITSLAKRSAWVAKTCRFTARSPRMKP